jgi:EAL domain-containing protein (putative c-di-GMP-specific phosphodiesterase class I)
MHARAELVKSPSQLASDHGYVEPTWTMIGHCYDAAGVTQARVESNPFKVGRSERAELTIRRPTVSQLHAELKLEAGQLAARDLQSRNGTFINGQRVEDWRELKEGDLIQFADVPFRVCRESVKSPTHTATDTSADKAFLLFQFDRMIDQRAVKAHFQPIVRMSDFCIVGYEMLGRSSMLGLERPKEMFDIASAVDAEKTLSELLRAVGMEASVQVPQDLNLFINTHPSELSDAGIVRSMRELRAKFPQRKLTLEIHEASMTDPNTIREIRIALADLEVQLAYDDFGAGQARLLELCDSPPDYLKFDRCLIQELHQASLIRRRMVRQLVEVARSVGIMTIAECVESQEEHAACLELGFELGQGFYYGPPRSIQDLQRQTETPAG